MKIDEPQPQSHLVSKKVRWLCAIAGVASGVAGCGQVGYFGALAGVPLIAASIVAGRWQRFGRGLMWFGAIYSTFLVLPYPILIVFRILLRILDLTPGSFPNPIVIEMYAPAIIFVIWFDMILAREVVKHGRAALS